MRFVFVISKLGQNGPAGTRIRLAEGLGRRGHRVEILVFSPVIERDIPAGVAVSTLDAPVERYPHSHAGRLRLALSLRRWLRQAAAEPIDFLSSSLTGTDRVLRMAGVRDARRWLHVATSKLLDDVETPGRRRRRARLYRRLYDGERVIGVSQGVIDDLALIGARPLQADLLYNAFDAERLRALAAEAPADPPLGPYVLHSGRFAGPKRYDVLFAAFAAQATPHRLVLLTEEKPDLRRLIAMYGLEGRVTVAGFHQNPFPLMARADAFVLSSDREGFGNVLVESLILGVPVVSTDCPAGPSEILTGPYARWLSPVGDVDALAANLAAVLAEPYAIEPWLHERFSLEAALDRLEAIAARGPRPSLGRLRPLA